MLRKYRVRWGLLFVLLLKVGKLAGHELGGPDHDEEHIRRSLKKVSLQVSVETVISQEKGANWVSEMSKTLLPGQPLNLRMMADNALILVRLSPYLHGYKSYTVLTQSEYWLEGEDKDKVHYHNQARTLFVKEGKEVIFFPLGKKMQKKGKQAPIQMAIRIKQQPVDEIPDEGLPDEKQSSDAQPTAGPKKPFRVNKSQKRA